MPFELLKKKLFSRLDSMGVRIIQTYEEVFSPQCALELLHYDKKQLGVLFT